MGVMKPFNVASKRRVQNLERWVQEGRISEVALQVFYQRWRNDGFHDANKYYEQLIQRMNQ